MNVQGMSSKLQGKKKHKSKPEYSGPKISAYLTRARRAREDRVRETRDKNSLTGELTTGELDVQLQDRQLDSPTSEGSEIMSVQGEPPQDPVLKAISDLEISLKAEMTTNKTSTEKKISDLDTDVKKWKSEIETKIDAFELKAKKQDEDLVAMKGTVDFMEKTATDVYQHAEGIDKTFINVDMKFRTERLLTVKALLQLEERVNSLERELRAYNIRVQGLKVADGQNIKSAIIQTFKEVAPELQKSHIEYAFKLSSKKDQAPPLVAENGAGQQAQRDPIILIKFTDKNLRNKIFFKAKKFQFEPKIVVKDDHTKANYEKWQKAKPQMGDAYFEKKKSTYRNGRLTIDSKQIPIVGVDTEAQILAKAYDDAKLDIIRLKKK